MSRNRVLLLMTTFGVGGAERVIVRLAAGLSDRYEVHVAALSEGTGQLRPHLRALDGVTVHCLGMRSKLDVLGAGIRLLRLLRTQRYDILHSFLFHANVMGRICARLAGVPAIISSERVMGMEGLARRLVNRLTAPLADLVTVNAQRMFAYAESTIGISTDKLRLIYNGVPVAPGAPFPFPVGDACSRFVVTVVARLDPQKGHQYLLEGLARVRSRIPGLRLVFVGDGPHRTSLEELTARLGMADCVEFAGLQQEVLGYLKATDLVVLPSLFEGFPNAVLEAMAVGRPVVATDVAGTAEAVVDGETGFIVPAQDAGALADRVVRLAADPELRNRMGKAGFDRVKSLFTVERMVEETEKLYQSLISH